MTDEIYEITYETEMGSGLIRLDCSCTEFDEKLRIIEQSLADNHAKNIVYLRRSRRADDFPVDEHIYEQQMLPGTEELFK